MHSGFNRPGLLFEQLQKSDVDGFNDRQLFDCPAEIDPMYDEFTPFNTSGITFKRVRVRLHNRKSPKPRGNNPTVSNPHRLAQYKNPYTAKGMTMDEACSLHSCLQVLLVLAIPCTSSITKCSVNCTAQEERGMTLW